MTDDTITDNVRINGISKRQYNLLTDIMNNTKLFDRRDNTFLVSSRKIADRLHISASKVDQLMRVLSIKDLVRMVIINNKEGGCYVATGC